MELIRLKLVWQTGKLLQQGGKQKSVWRCELRDFEGETSIMPLKTPSPVLFCAVPGISNNSFTNHSWFAVDYFWITLNIFPSCFIIELFHPRDCCLCDKLWCVPRAWCRFNSLLCVAVKMCNCWNASCNLVFRFSGSQHCGHVHCAYQYREHYHCMDPECNYQVSVSTSSLFLSITQIHSLHFHLYAACFSIMSLSHRSDSEKMRKIR